MKFKTMGWTTGRRCNVIDEGGRVLIYDTYCISDPFEFHGNGKLEIAIMVQGVPHAVPISLISEPIRQLEIDF